MVAHLTDFNCFGIDTRMGYCPQGGRRNEKSIAGTNYYWCQLGGFGSYFGIKKQPDRCQKSALSNAEKAIGKYAKSR